jgi:hypothetical protein
MVGTLLAHGAATNPREPNGAPSYFIRVQTERGTREIWNAGLKHAFASSKTQPQVGEEIGVRRNSLDPITFVLRTRDADGRIMIEQRKETPRPHWIVERREFFDERAHMARIVRDSRVHPRDAIRDHRELIGAYMLLDTAKKVAAQRIRTSEGTARFLALLRESLAQLIERGEKLPVAWIREPQAPSDVKSKIPQPREREGRSP